MEMIMLFEKAQEIKIREKEETHSLTWQLDFLPALTGFVTVGDIFRSTQCTSLLQCNFLNAVLLLIIF